MSNGEKFPPYLSTIRALALPPGTTDEDADDALTEAQWGFAVLEAEEAGYGPPRREDHRPQRESRK